MQAGSTTPCGRYIFKVRSRFKLGSHSRPSMIPVYVRHQLAFEKKYMTSKAVIFLKFNDFGVTVKHWIGDVSVFF